MKVVYSEESTSENDSDWEEGKLVLYKYDNAHFVSPTTLEMKLWFSPLGPCHFQSKPLVRKDLF